MAIARRWLDTALICSSDTYPQLVLLDGLCGRAAGRIHQAIVESARGETLIQPVLAEPDGTGSTDSVAFDTLKPVEPVRKSHLNSVVLDSGWEAKVGQVLDSMPEVEAWVKNDRLGPDRRGLRIPYTDAGRPAEYIPDFIARINADGQEAWHLLLEVTGERRDAKLAKAGTALNLWLPAVRHWGRLGDWAYVEIHDPFMAEDQLRAVIAERRKEAVHA